MTEPVTLRCRRCHRTQDQVFAAALAVAFGAKTRRPDKCVDGKDHDFAALAEAAHGPDDRDERRVGP